MSIEKLEEVRSKLNHYKFLMSSWTMETILDNLIPILKHQSDQIADLKQDLAKKEDVIDVNDIKEVKNLNG